MLDDDGTVSCFEDIDFPISRPVSQLVVGVSLQMILLRDSYTEEPISKEIIIIDPIFDMGLCKAGLVT